jgi:hypothetical protein
MFDPVFQIKNKGRKRRREEEISDSLTHSFFIPAEREKREAKREKGEERDCSDPTQTTLCTVWYGTVW